MITSASLQPLELRRRFRMPGMAAATPISHQEAVDQVSTGRVQTVTEVRVPVLSQQALSDLCFFSGMQAVPAHPALGAALKTLEKAGWCFGARGGAVGAFGAYVALTDERFQPEGLHAAKNGLLVELLDSQAVQSWGASCAQTGCVAEVAREVGPAGLEALQHQNPERFLLDQGRYHEARNMLPKDHPLTEVFSGLPPRSESLVALYGLLDEEPARATAALMPHTTGRELNRLVDVMGEHYRESPSVKLGLALVSQPYSQMDQGTLRAAFEHANDKTIGPELLTKIFQTSSLLERRLLPGKLLKALREADAGLAPLLEHLEPGRRDLGQELIRLVRERAELVSMTRVSASSVLDTPQAVTLRGVRLKKR